MIKHPTSRGFTIIELLVVIVFGAVIVIGLFSSLTSVQALSIGTTQRTIASNIAYANLRHYADGTPPIWFICNTTNQTAPITLMDKTEPKDRLPGNVRQTVTATAVYGCDGLNQGLPLRIISTVQLDNGIEVSHATYAGY